MSIHHSPIIKILHFPKSVDEIRERFPHPSRHGGSGNPKHYLRYNVPGAFVMYTQNLINVECVDVRTKQTSSYDLALYLQKYFQAAMNFVSNKDFSGIARSIESANEREDFEEAWQLMNCAINKQTIIIVAAKAKNDTIGKDNTLPWKLPEDMKKFKEVTTGGTVIMGRKTFESIKHPLRDRENIIITRQPNYLAKGCKLASSLDTAIDLATNEKIFIIGGAQVYQKAMTKASMMYITEIDHNFEGDTFFPKIDVTFRGNWKRICREHHKSTPENPWNFTFSKYQRA